ncbi:signal peptidase I [Occallatibacter riparius]|uniref:Signal peptidase I n=1 Tax=Occallatibacter riparius TaxID=1002689 RepID=A0A9J7BK74_9BACT|nr:signal peptidase I [Occallatibacter riparius]UWZ82178.1 signal peptidase I [Occallatibacter riparius]
MSSPAPVTGHPVEQKLPMVGNARQHAFAHLRVNLPSVPEAFGSLLRTVVVALFLLTFVLQPFLIPSESMEHTLLVGDFLLVNKQIFAPAGRRSSLERLILPYRDVKRGDIVVFHHPNPPLLIKRVVGVPGDRIRMEDGRVEVNEAPLAEPYAAFEPAAANPFRDNFPARVYTDPNINPDWWRQMQKLTRNGELVVPPGMYFMLGDNRNHSEDSRFWGLVPREAIIARPLVIYFSLERPSTTDVEQASDDRLGHDRELSARLTGFARWKRIFRIVH